MALNRCPLSVKTVVTYGAYSAPGMPVGVALALPGTWSTRAYSRVEAWLRSLCLVQQDSQATVQLAIIRKHHSKARRPAGPVAISVVQVHNLVNIRHVELDENLARAGLHSGPGGCQVGVPVTVM